jgi:hypothetical protein
LPQDGRIKLKLGKGREMDTGGDASGAIGTASGAAGRAARGVLV